MVPKENLTADIELVVDTKSSTDSSFHVGWRGRQYKSLKPPNPLAG